MRTFRPQLKVAAALAVALVAWPLDLVVAPRTPLAAVAQARDLPVDLELILAIDVSSSVDQREGQLQREGYIRAFADPRIAQAIQNGRFGRVAVRYVEWSRAGYEYPITPWRVLGNAADALSYSRELANTPITGAVGTSITSMIRTGVQMFQSNGFEGTRRVIDIGGDGPNSNGGPVKVARDEAVDAGIIINGVAINDRDITWFSLRDLDLYYEECVIGGPGAFVVAVDGFASFAEAILRKLILEIADAAPAGVERFGAATVIPVQMLGAPRPRRYGPACTIGEEMLRMDQMGFPPGTPFR
jgi:hypothetical protein